MAETQDFAVLRGLAQVIPQQSSSNVYALARIGMMQKQNARELAAKKQQQDQEWFQKESALGFPQVRSELQRGLVGSFRRATGGMTEIYKESAKAGGLTPDGRQAITDIKNNHMAEEAMVKSLDSDLTRVEQVIKEDKQDTFNRGVFGTKMKDILDNAYSVDGDQLTINPEASVKLSGLLDDPDVYNDAALAKDFITKLGTVATSTLDETSGAYISSGSSMTKGLYKTKSDGVTPELNPNTGKPIPEATPEAIAVWDGAPGSIQEKKLDRWAQSITPEGQDWRLNRQKAFKKFVVNQFGDYKESAKSVNEKSSAGQDKIDKAQIASDRYKNVRSMVYEPTTANSGLLQQTFDPAGKLKAEYVFTDGDQGGDSATKIVLSRRELHYPDLAHPLEAKYTGWLPFEEIPIVTQPEKEAAMNRLNSLVDQAGAAKDAIGPDAFEKQHKAYKQKNPTQIKLGFK